MVNQPTHTLLKVQHLENPDFKKLKTCNMPTKYKQFQVLFVKLNINLSIFNIVFLLIQDFEADFP